MRTSGADTGVSPGPITQDVATITIGLVGAPKKRGGERHFETLLDAASPGRVTLRHFTLGPDLAALWETELDGLIVAGAEPRAATMPEEPIWPDLARLVDWAGANTVSTIWSCFAAHAAVFRMDGIVRDRLPQKLSGVFQCASAIGLAAGWPAQIPVPHSRCNNLSEEALLDAGYTILSRAPAIGADTFCKPHLASQFLFLQGHPEYGPRTLASEYMRDIGRFLAATSPYPEMPADYFAPAGEAALGALRAQLIAAPDKAVFAAFPWAELQLLDHDWHTPARRLYAGWIDDIAARKATGK